MSSFVKSLFDINVRLTRIFNEPAMLSFGMTGGFDDSLVLDAFVIKNRNYEVIWNKMTNTIIHNIACVLEDSDPDNEHFSVVRGKDDYTVICKTSIGFRRCMIVIRNEIAYIEKQLNKCRADIKKLSKSFGADTVKYIADKNVIQREQADHDTN